MEEDKILKDAQYRKSLSIAYFNSLNSAIELVDKKKSKTQLKKDIAYWRDWFIQEHKKHYKKVIENVGEPFVVEDTLKKIRKTKTRSELLKVWVGLSQDERNNKQIKSEVTKLKNKYEKVKSNKTGKRRLASDKKRENNGDDTKVDNGNTKS